MAPVPRAVAVRHHNLAAVSLFGLLSGLTGTVL